MTTAPLSTLLSHALIAYTIELDNHFEVRVPHHTTSFGSSAPPGTRGVWLTSLVMWSNFLRYVDDCATVAEVQAAARISDRGTHTSVQGMERWGYVQVARGPGDKRLKTRGSWSLQLTPAGRVASEVWRALPAEIDTRWRERFGAASVKQLRASLSQVVAQLDPGLPDHLPIGHYQDGLRADPVQPVRGKAASELGPDAGLATLLSRVLHAFTNEAESRSELSLALAANVVRVLDERGVVLGDVPQLTGVSKEAVTFSLGLEKQGLLIVEPSPDSTRTKVARLTPLGIERRDAAANAVAEVERGWSKTFGPAIKPLRSALETIVGNPDAPFDSSPLATGLEPLPAGWRGKVPPRTALPHHPMVLHRGGFPDGS